jgi:hypothetical protein
MKKILIGLLLLTSLPSFAVSFKGSPLPMVQDNTVVVPKVEEWMKTKAGRVTKYNKDQNVIMVNGNMHLITKDTKVYDGPAKVGSHIKYNINDKNVIIDMWVRKK